MQKSDSMECGLTRKISRSHSSRAFDGAAPYPFRREPFVIEEDLILGQQLIVWLDGRENRDRKALG
jgi:hypothetical protein